ncbi:unnamed protein product [Blepharisma stoltei]|uniref:Uncharacterized protein n=1 Tax=Blepharisma stoltei TaxID=1481888 RepID=A0AAU9IHF8_9CILI|nr:unnamed protein product [Blepharisma stoltei]
MLFISNGKIDIENNRVAFGKLFWILIRCGFIYGALALSTKILVKYFPAVTDRSKINVSMFRNSLETTKSIPNSSKILLHFWWFSPKALISVILL